MRRASALSLVLVLWACKPAVTTTKPLSLLSATPTPKPTIIPGQNPPSATASPTPTPLPTASPVGTPAQKKIVVSWTANRDSAVNRAGGGYKVYFSTTQGFAISGANVLNVPYVSGGLAPTTATLTGLASGTYYIKVVPYSAQNASGPVSAEIKVVIP